MTEILLSLTAFHNVSLLESGLYRLRLAFEPAEACSLASWSRLSAPVSSVRGRQLAQPGVSELSVDCVEIDQPFVADSSIL